VPVEPVIEPVEAVTPVENPTVTVEPTDSTTPIESEPLKAVNDATPVDTSPVQDTVPVTEDIKPVEPTQVTTDVPVPDAKDTRIAELEAAVIKLQGNVTTFEADKKKAIEDAEKKFKEELIEEIEKALPSGHIISNFNRGGQVLAEDIRRVIYNIKKGK